jgi:hypothetical protein
MSFKAYRSGSALPYGDGELNFNMCISKNKRFKGIITQQQISPTLEFEDVKEWNVTVLGIVCFDAACGGQAEC